ncbi:MAG: hypothetical protein ACOX9R_11055 [Armatimonadota bacterium]|jgi:hypothetical protein
MGVERGNDGGGQSRRTFIRTLGVLGGALAASGVASADTVGLSSDARSIAQRVRRSSTALRLQQAPALQKLSRRGPQVSAELPTPPTLGEPPLPSTRQRLLNALASAPGGGVNLSALGLAQGAGGRWGRSEPLTQIMSTDPLALAYAEGITLTPEGLQFSADAGYHGPPPMRYATLQAMATPDLFGERLCLVTADHPFPGSFFSVVFNTPGGPQSAITYAVEVSMEPYDPGFECFIGSLPAGAPYQSAAVNFVPTNDGTQMALLEIRGSGATSEFAHSIRFRRGTGTALLTHFNWMNVVAL